MIASFLSKYFLRLCVFALFFRFYDFIILWET